MRTMQLGQKIGAAILMLIPSLLGGAGAYDYLHSWIAVIIWLALMPVLYWAIITGRIFKFKETA